MLLDKRKVSYFTKIGAVIVALAFIVTFIPYIDLIPGSSGVDQQLQPAQQIASLEKAVQANPKDAQAWVRLGDAYRDLDLAPDRVVECYKKALEINPKMVNVRVDLADSYFKLGQIETATAEAKKAIEANSGYALAYYSLGTFLNAQGKIAEAIKAYENYIKLAPNGSKVSEVKARLGVLKKESNSLTTNNTDTGK